MVQAGIPIVAALLTVVFVGKAVFRTGPRVDAVLRDQVDEIHARVVRIFTVTTLAFAGIHKLNADFFAAESCANLASRLHTWWTLPFEAPTAGPVAVVVLELLAAVMLLVYPRVGILLVVYTMAGLGHIGPAAFASTCMVMSLAYLDRGDIALLRRFFARHWGVVVAATVIVIVGSYSTYESPLPWLKYGLFETVVVVVVCIVVGTGVMRLRQRSTLKRRLVPAALRWWRRPATVMPGLASWLALILIVNGMTPYLGVKYRFSTAMLSNLRVDQERWNSYVFPRWMSLRKQTPQVVVVWQPHGRWEPPKARQGQYLLGDGLYSPTALSIALRDAAARRARGKLSVTYMNETAEFELPTDMLVVGAWVERWPSSVLWQDRLGPGDQPQSCVH